MQIDLTNCEIEKNQQSVVAGGGAILTIASLQQIDAINPYIFFRGRVTFLPPHQRFAKFGYSKWWNTCRKLADTSYDTDET